MESSVLIVEVCCLLIDFSFNDTGITSYHSYDINDNRTIHTSFWLCNLIVTSNNVVNLNTIQYKKIILLDVLLPFVYLNCQKISQDEVKSPDGKRRKRILRGFLVDGAIIPGSGGSPVALPPVSVRNVYGRLQIQTFFVVIIGDDRRI